MANPLFNALRGNVAPTVPAPTSNNFMQMMQAFNQFRGAFKGNPQQTVQQLLNTGRMTQAQYNQLGQMAQQFMQMMGK